MNTATRKLGSITEVTLPEDNKYPWEYLHGSIVGVQWHALMSWAVADVEELEVTCRGNLGDRFAMTEVPKMDYATPTGRLPPPLH